MAGKKKQNTQQQKQMAVTRNVPAATATTAARKPPRVQATQDGMNITHTEFIGDVFARTTATTQSYIINPQNSTTFTWLSAIATRFEYYKFNSLKLHYKPSCGTTNAGFVIIGVDYDFYDSAPSKAAMLAWKFATKSALYEHCTVNATAGLGQVSWKYNDTYYYNGDQRITNLGKIWVLTDNAPSTINSGELFIEYSISFKQPSIKIPPALYGRSNYNETTDWVVQSANTIVNLVRTYGSYHTLSTVGQYLVTVTADRATALSDIQLLFTADADSPQTEFYSTELKRVNDGTNGIGEWFLELASGVVRLQPVLTGTGALAASILISTYKQ